MGPPSSQLACAGSHIDRNQSNLPTPIQRNQWLGHGPCAVQSVRRDKDEMSQRWWASVGGHTAGFRCIGIAWTACVSAAEIRGGHCRQERNWPLFSRTPGMWPLSHQPLIHRCHRLGTTPGFGLRPQQWSWAAVSDPDHSAFIVEDIRALVLNSVACISLGHQWGRADDTPVRSKTASASAPIGRPK